MIYFFGYGADRDPEMIKAIIGRIPKGEKATVSGFELCVQSLADLPHKAQQIVKNSWDHSFRSYSLRASKDINSVVEGMMWELSPLERKLIDNWELTGLWYNVFLMNLEAPKKMQLEIQVIQDQSVREVAHGKQYKTFLNPKEKMLEVANRLRIDYLKNN